MKRSSLNETLVFDDGWQKFMRTHVQQISIVYVPNRILMKMCNADVLCACWRGNCYNFVNGMCIVFPVTASSRLTQFAEYMAGRPAVAQQLARLSLLVHIPLAGECKTATGVITCSSRIDTVHTKWRRDGGYSFLHAVLLYMEANFIIDHVMRLLLLQEKICFLDHKFSPCWRSALKT